MLSAHAWEKKTVPYGGSSRVNLFPVMFTEHMWELFGNLGVWQGGVNSHACSLEKRNCCCFVKRFLVSGITFLKYYASNKEVGSVYFNPLASYEL